MNGLWNVIERGMKIMVKKNMTRIIQEYFNMNNLEVQSSVNTGMDHEPGLSPEECLDWKRQGIRGG